MELLTRCRDVALPFYGELFKSAQPLLRERLFEQAERAANQRDEQLFLGAIQTLNDNYQQMVDSFEAALRDGYERFADGRDPLPATLTQQPRSDALALVASEQLEDELAVSAIVSRGNSLYSENLWALNRRLAVARGGRKVADEHNPFGPAHVGCALQVAMSHADCALKARLFMYKYLGKLFLAAFPQMLATLNERLRADGILPNLRHEVHKAAPVPAVGRSGIAKAVSPQAEAARQRGIYRAVTAELARELSERNGPRTQTLTGVSYQGLATGGEAGSATFRPIDYALILSALQHTPEFAAPALLMRPFAIQAAEERLFAQLKKQAHEEHRHRVAAPEANIIDLLGMLFRALLEDDKLPDPVRALLSHLHTPYLKLALLEPGVLDDPDHHARRLLDRMAAVGAWVSGPDDRVVLPKLREIVEGVLRGFVDDSGIFTDLLADLDGFAEGLERRAALVERRSRDAQEGIERLQIARRHAADAVAERLRGRALPEHISRLLREPWGDFLAFNYLRGGDEGLAWRAALKVVDGVLWSVQGSGERDPAAFDNHRRQLERSLAEGLRTIGYDSAAGERLMGALREAQDQAAAGRPVVAEPLAPAAPDTPATPAFPLDDAPLNEAEQAVADELLRRIDFGSWFEVIRPAQPPVHWRIAWFSQVTSRCMFVNHAGVKQAVTTVAELARNVQAGRMRLLEERASFMERALTAVLRRLRRVPQLAD